jgi:hypothetical protein
MLAFWIVFGPVYPFAPLFGIYYSLRALVKERDYLVCLCMLTMYCLGAYAWITPLAGPD